MLAGLVACQFCVVHTSFLNGLSMKKSEHFKLNLMTLTSIM